MKTEQQLVMVTKNTLFAMFERGDERLALLGAVHLAVKLELISLEQAEVLNLMASKEKHRRRSWARGWLNGMEEAAAAIKKRRVK